MKKKKAFTFIEVLILLCILCIITIIVTVLTVGLFGNFWFTSDGVLKEIQYHDPNVAKITKTHRNVFSYSEIFVEDKDDKRYSYELDTNVLFNYEIVK